ncbi:MAG: hypothetical protein K2R98_31885 [Gemmataceae bacterium]|nr:hypothetical protein [Gemmataceae bacterium]
MGLILDAVFEVWPDGLFQDAEHDDLHPLSAAPVDQRADEPHEFFVYKDQSAAISWNRNGWTEEFGDDMIHFLSAECAARPDVVQLTLVIGTATSETLRLVATVFDALTQMAADDPALRLHSRRVDWDAELQAVGFTSGKENFYAKVEGMSKILFPGWTADELACHPHEAQQLCEIVRRLVAPVPDYLVMKALMNRRKQPKRPANTAKPRLIWRA